MSKPLVSDRATLTSTGIRNTNTSSTPSTFFKEQAEPVSVQRGIIPNVTPRSSRNVMPKDLPIKVAAVLPVEDRRVSSASFDMAPISAPMANTLRRIIMTEVPTMAIDRVVIEENDGVVVDELLSQRLGLCPLIASPEHFKYVSDNAQMDLVGGQPNANLCLRFDLDVSVPRDCAPGTVVIVTSGDLKWIPLEGQSTLNPQPRPVHSDITLAKLGRGQRIKLSAYALKGTAVTHAKWSPVSACWYDMENHVSLLNEAARSQGERVVRACAKKAFEKAQDAAHITESHLAHCAICRQKTVHGETEDQTAELKRGFRLEKDKNHIRFTVESLGQYEHPIAIVKVALKEFALRCRDLKERVKHCPAQAPVDVTA